MMVRSFASSRELDAWLAAHADRPELWVRIFKKASGIASVTWQECVVVAIAWGWIDSRRRSLDDVSFLQRLTPRRARSHWSAINLAHAARLIEAGRMQPAGLASVQASAPVRTSGERS